MERKITNLSFRGKLIITSKGADISASSSGLLGFEPTSSTTNSFGCIMKQVRSQLLNCDGKCQLTTD